MSDTASPEVTLAAVGLSRRYGNNLAVDNISMELKRGEIVGLLGPNGAGKTTTMKMITGNLAPSAGSVIVCGVDLIDQPTSAKARIGYLPEVPPLYKELRVDEFLRLAGRLHRLRKQDINDAVERETPHRLGRDGAKADRFAVQRLPAARRNRSGNHSQTGRGHPR